MNQRSTLRRLTLLGALAVTAAAWGYATVEARWLASELEELAERHAGEHRKPGEETAIYVTAAREYVIAGAPVGKIEVFIRPEGVTDVQLIGGIEYNYRKESGEWRFMGSGHCSGADCNIRALEAFGEHDAAERVQVARADEPGSGRRARNTLLGFDLSDSAIPRDEIMRGGPPRDGIPAIMEPNFAAVEDVDFLADSEQVLAFEHNGDARAYPLMIMLWHEIVNDEVGGKAIAATYCPLCGTAMVFDRRVGGRTFTFGVSGLLYKSDVLMYDHQTESLWSQLKTEGVTGEMKGRELVWLPSQQMTWAAWRERHPDGKVLTPDTGYNRHYGHNPYAAYEHTAEIMFPVPETRDEFPRKAWVWGVIADGTPKAYPLERLEKQGLGEFVDRVGGAAVTVKYDAEAEYVEIRDADGEPLPVVRVYWFAWQGFYPDTEIFGDAAATRLP